MEKRFHVQHEGTFLFKPNKVARCMNTMKKLSKRKLGRKGFMLNIEGLHGQHEAFSCLLQWKEVDAYFSKSCVIFPRLPQLCGPKFVGWNDYGSVSAGSYASKAFNIYWGVYVEHAIRHLQHERRSTNVTKVVTFLSQKGIFSTFSSHFLTCRIGHRVPVLTHVVLSLS